MTNLSADHPLRLHRPLRLHHSRLLRKEVEEEVAAELQELLEEEEDVVVEVAVVRLKRLNIFKRLNLSSLKRTTIRATTLWINL